MAIPLVYNQEETNIREISTQLHVAQTDGAEISGET